MRPGENRIPPQFLPHFGPSKRRAYNSQMRGRRGLKKIEQKGILSLFKMSPSVFDFEVCGIQDTRWKRQKYGSGENRDTDCTYYSVTLNLGRITVVMEGYSICWFAIQMCGLFGGF